MYQKYMLLEEKKLTKGYGNPTFTHPFNVNVVNTVIPPHQWQSQDEGSYHNTKFPVHSASGLLLKTLLQVLLPRTLFAAPMTCPWDSRTFLRLLLSMQEYNPDNRGHNLTSEVSFSWDLLALFIYQLPLNARDSHGIWDLGSPPIGHITSLKKLPLPPTTDDPEAFTICRDDGRLHQNPSSLPASQWDCWTSHKKYALVLLGSWGRLSRIFMERENILLS